MKHSAGILLHKYENGNCFVLLVHPGGPLWSGKDNGSWGIPKGEFIPGQELVIDAARREFEEEIGVAAPDRPAYLIGEFKSSKHKTIHVVVIHGDLNVDNTKSNMFNMEWPPKSGNIQEFPEIDRSQWFSMDEAKEKIISGQMQILIAFDVWRKTSRYEQLYSRNIQQN